MKFERGIINERVLQDLKKRSSIGLIFYVILSLIGILAWGFYQRHPLLSSLFLLGNIAICLFRLIHLVAAKKMGVRYAQINKQIFFASVIITALIWGVSLASIQLLKNEHATQLLMTVCLCGLCAGGVVAFIPYRRLSFIYNMAMLLPAALAILTITSNFPLAAMFLLYSVYMILVAQRGNREYWDALENEHLLEVKSRELAVLSHTDVLTGLYNRRYFDKILDAEYRRAGRENRQLAVAIFDLDHFKVINDTCGHQVGDMYLKKAAEAFSAIFKRETDVVARFGGEEFIVLLPGMTSDGAFRLAEKVRQRIQTISVRHESRDVMVTISAGIMCCVPDFNARPDYIISLADQALYEAKQRGRNKVVVSTYAVC